jgi:hypothetical protein
MDLRSGKTSKRDKSRKPSGDIVILKSQKSPSLSEANPFEANPLEEKECWILPEIFRLQAHLVMQCYQLEITY